MAKRGVDPERQRVVVTVDFRDDSRLRALAVGDLLLRNIYGGNKVDVIRGLCAMHAPELLDPKHFGKKETT